MQVQQHIRTNQVGIYLQPDDLDSLHSCGSYLVWRLLTSCVSGIPVRAFVNWECASGILEDHPVGNRSLFGTDGSQPNLWNIFHLDARDSSRTNINFAVVTQVYGILLLSVHTCVECIEPQVATLLYSHIEPPVDPSVQCDPGVGQYASVCNQIGMLMFIKPPAEMRHSRTPGAGLSGKC